MLYFLTGTTASGKSAIAHKIAIEKNIPILSLDSMAVYKGLDILTAKPTEVMRTEVLYFGLDIAETDQNFSVVDYLNYLIDKNIPKLSFEQDILVVGGTGLYYKSIIDSLKCKDAIRKASILMGAKGRVLVRKSGTEQKIRIMAESHDKRLISECIKLIKKSIN